MRNNERNPWFHEFWELHFDCKFSDGAVIQKCDGKNCKNPTYENILKKEDLETGKMEKICTGYEVIGVNSRKYLNIYHHLVSSMELFVIRKS